MDSQPVGWDLSNAPKQSITEVLQNPYSSSSLSLAELPAFEFSSSTTTPLPPRSPPLDINHFEGYLRRYAPLYADFIKEKERLDLSSTSTPTQQTPIPDIYYSSKFSVASNPHLAYLQPAGGSSHALPELQVDKLRETLGTQRASLEAQLRQTLTDQSEPIRDALTKARELREELHSTAAALREARTRAGELVPMVADGLRLTRAVLSVQENARQVRSALGLLQYVVNAPDDVADLIRTGEYEGAIRVVAEAKQALVTKEFAGVVALTPVRGRLARAVESIDAALRDEFRVAMRAGKGHEETLAFVVRLVDSMGRLPLLQGVFLQEVREKLRKELLGAQSISSACRAVRESAKQSILIVDIIHGKDGEEEVGAKRKERPDLRKVHEEMEAMLAAVVDRYLGSFSSSVDTGAAPDGRHSGFVVITEMEALTEQTCFDEIKGALRFGEELRLLEEMSRELDEIFSSEKKSSSLRAKISERQIAFLSTFHKAHVDVVTKTVRSDKWKEVAVPSGALRLLAAVLDDEDQDASMNGHRNGEHGTGPGPHVEGNFVNRTKGAVVISGDIFKTVACGVRYLRSLCAYTLVAEKSPTLAPEIARRGTELSRLFNSLVRQAILGAQALQGPGLRSITARHLSLASRTIAIAVVLGNRVNRSLGNALSDAQADVILPLIQVSEKDLREHHGQLLAKILTIMMDRLEIHERVLKSLPWDKALEMQRFVVPSAYITSLVKEATVLHRILWSLLPQLEACDIYQRVCAAYGDHLTEAYGSLDGGKKWIRSRVAEDVSFLHERLHLLDVFKANPVAIKPISKLYARFAKEYAEEKDKKEEKSLFPGRLFIRREEDAVTDRTTKPSSGQENGKRPDERPAPASPEGKKDSPAEKFITRSPELSPASASRSKQVDEPSTDALLANQTSVVGIQSTGGDNISKAAPASENSKKDGDVHSKQPHEEGIAGGFNSDQSSIDLQRGVVTVHATNASSGEDNRKGRNENPAPANPQGEAGSPAKDVTNLNAEMFPASASRSKQVEEPATKALHANQAGVSGIQSTGDNVSKAAPAPENEQQDGDVHSEELREQVIVDGCIRDQSSMDLEASQNGGPNIVPVDSHLPKSNGEGNGPVDGGEATDPGPLDQAFEDDMNRILDVQAEDSHSPSNGVKELVHSSIDAASISAQPEDNNFNPPASKQVQEGDLLGLN